MDDIWYRIEFEKFPHSVIKLPPSYQINTDEMFLSWMKHMNIFTPIDLKSMNTMKTVKGNEKCVSWIKLHINKRRYPISERILNQFVNLYIALFDRLAWVALQYNVGRYMEINTYWTIPEVAKPFYSLYEKLVPFNSVVFLSCHSSVIFLVLYTSVNLFNVLHCCTLL